MIELNSETDFVARNEQFQTLVHEVANEALVSGTDIEALKAQKMSAGNKTVSEAITEAIATIGENMSFALKSSKLSQAEQAKRVKLMTQVG